MNGKGNANLIKRLELIEQVLEVNEIRVYYASEKLSGSPGVKIIRLKWLDVSEVPLYERIGEEWNNIPT
jgi:hypothetical protein